MIEATVKKAPALQQVVVASIDIARLITSTAQRTSDPKPKIDASIELGRKRYWKSLVSSADFPGHSLRDCLDVLHFDIVKVWNFADPEEFLLSAKLKAAVTKMCGITQKSTWERLGKEIGFVAGLSGVAGAASGPLAVITAPAVFGGVLFAAWFVETYRAMLSHSFSWSDGRRFHSPEHARWLMAYILNLLGILKRIPQTREPLTLESLDKAISAWGPLVPKLQGDIDKFLNSGKYKVVMQKDPIIEKIRTLAEQYMVM
ncbi:hypothetical protein DL96DRAFT_350869 [Flagelloscypha sp. PMI_526]|nr:hypothetical protein DL96DRAFT_350869 [Flagelloscypha sp. PMI_526]